MHRPWGSFAKTLLMFPNKLTKGLHMKMKLSEIRIDGGTQSRTKINKEVVDEYSEYLTEGKKLPAVKVYSDGVNNWLADGFHRFFAHRAAKFTEIECDVENGTLRDAILYSVGANNDHGLRRSNDDKRKAVQTLLDDLEWSDWSDSEIARRCHVSVMTVSRLKKKLNIKDTTKKFIKNGKESVMNTENIGVVKKEEVEDDSEIQELAVAHKELAEENARLMDMLSVQRMDATPEEKTQAQETLDSLRAEVKRLEAELHAVKISRDQLQAKTNEMQKQINYWRKKAEKVAA